MDWNGFGATLRIAVLSGGDSAEREVSLASGVRVRDALAAAGHEPTLIDPAEIDLTQVIWADYDACFIALHGGAGEDGRIQQQLDDLNVPYTGSGPAASRLAMSKSASKERFLQDGVPTKPYLLLHSSDNLDAIANRVADLGWPLIVKPDSQGSSLGVNIAQSADELPAALTAAWQYDPFAIVEPLIVGREFTVALLGRKTLPLLEIVAPQQLFTYEAKYASLATRLRFDPPLGRGQALILQTVALAAADALDTRGLARVDLMLDRAGMPWVLEVNTIPGLTERSLAPRAARQASIGLPALCDWAVRDCLTLESVL